MKTDPILRGPKIYTADGTTYRLTATGGLHYIRGNSAPYFSLTADQDRKERGRWEEDCGGCCHDLILQHWPDLADLAALHLSDINGAPMHAESNGWYYLAGALNGAGERYHVGNSERHFPLPEDKRAPAKSWASTEYRFPTAAECLQIFADHIRAPLEEAQRIAEEVRAEFGPEQDDARIPAYLAGHTRSDYARGRAKWAQICETMRPRWLAEAQTCIARHGLQIYGDHGEGKA